jgi:hypothetical protein
MSTTPKEAPPTSIAAFARRNGISERTVYAELKKRRLVARKVGDRTLILPEDERAWLESLPRFVGEATQRGRRRATATAATA